MKFQSSGLNGLVFGMHEPRGDARGEFTRLYCDQRMQDAGVSKPVVQINHSFTRQKGAIRGLHFQWPPSAETKIIRCLRGAVWDVAVDLRAGSPTFLAWRACELTESNRRFVVIPEGFAHGFQALSDDAELIYLHTAPYTPEHEGGFHCFDERLAIAWPLPVTQQSPRDQGLPRIPEDFSGIALPASSF